MIFRLVIDIRLIDRVAVKDQLLVPQADAVSRHADAALDESLFNVNGIAENDDVAALHILYGIAYFETAPGGA